jgi:hypothetical protein
VHARLLRPASVLTALVGLISALRLLAAYGRELPLFFPDEYFYAELSRSLASGELTVRGGEVSFPALLYPLVGVPFWHWLEPAHAYRCLQAIAVLALGVSAFALYRFACRLLADRWLALAAAALLLLSPELVFLSFVTSEWLALPLAMGALLAGALALAEPRLRWQATFLALSVLSVGARVQLALVPVSFLAAVALLCALRRSRSPLREQRWPVAALLALGAAAALVAGLTQGGIAGYGRPEGLDSDPLVGARGLLVQLLGLGWMSGFLLPAAAVGLALCLVRPRSALEQGLAAIALPALVLLVLSADYYYWLAGTDDELGLQTIHGRYLLYALPLLFLGALALLRRELGAGARAGLALLTGGLVVLNAAIPLSELAVEARDHSAVLMAWAQWDSLLGQRYISRAYILLAGTILPLGALLLARSPSRRRRVVLLGGTAVFLAALSLASSLREVSSAQAVSERWFGGDTSWSRRAEAQPLTILALPGASRFLLQAQHFFRPDAAVATLGKFAPDRYPAQRLRIDRVGALRTQDGRPLRGGLLALESKSRLRFFSQRPLARTGAASLWELTPESRLELVQLGWGDGRLAARGYILLWPHGRQGWLEFKLRPERALRLRLTTPERVSDLTAPAAKTSLVRVAVCRTDRRRFIVHWQTEGSDLLHGAVLVGGELVAGDASPASFSPSPRACERPSPRQAQKRPSASSP